MKEIIFADESMKKEVNFLRQNEYAKAKGFSLDLSSLEWKDSDNESYVMAARLNHEMISTMRGEVIDGLTLLEKKLECPWDFSYPLEFPTLLLSRAATLSTSQSLGMNLVLRYWFIKLALHHHLSAVVGTFVSGSPREKSLKEMGYDFYENKFGWQQSSYRSFNPVQVVVLDLNKNGEKALNYCLEKVGKSISEFSFKDDFKNLKTVRRL